MNIHYVFGQGLKKIHDSLQKVANFYNSWNKIKQSLSTESGYFQLQLI